MSRKTGRSKKGISLVLVALLLLAIIMIAALVIDMSRLYIAKQRAQNVADACVLAGVWKLNGTPSGTGPAASEAQLIARDNNNYVSSLKVYQDDLLGEGVTVDFPTSFTADNGDSISVNIGEAIRVRCRVRVRYALAVTAGLSGNNPLAEAIALKENSVDIPLVPWGVNESVIFNANGSLNATPGITKVELHLESPSNPKEFPGPGNTQIVDYTDGGNPGNEYRKRIAGELGPVSLKAEDDLSSEKGEKAGGKHGLVDRRNIMGGDSVSFSYWFDQYKNGIFVDTWRLVIVPVLYEEYTDPYRVRGFAALFIETDADKWDGKSLTGTFVTGAVSGGILKWDPADPAGGNTFISTIRMVK